MQSVSSLSFKSDSNLLKKATMTPQSVGEVAQPQSSQTTQVITTEQQPKTDVYENKTTGKTSYLKEYGGVTALVVSALGIPITYAVTKKSNTKAMNKLQSAVEDLSEKLAKIDIDAKVKSALEQVAPKTDKPQDLASKKSNLVTVLLGIGTGLGISDFLKGNKEKLTGMGYTEDELSEAGSLATGLVENPKSALEKASSAHNIASSIGATAASAKSIAEDARNTANSMDARVNEVRNRADEALGAANSGIRPEMQKFVQKYYDLWITQTLGWDKKINNQRSEIVMDTVRNASVKRLDRSAKATLKDIKAYRETYKKELTSLWALTAEFKPIKLGGLGDVPVDLQDNFTKLGIDNPTFIPMYETPGVSRFIGEGEVVSKFIYGKKTYNLQKLASTEIDVFKNGTTKP